MLKICKTCRNMHGKEKFVRIDGKKVRTRMCYQIEAAGVPDRDSLEARVEKIFGGHARMNVNSPGCSKWQPKLTIPEVADIANQQATLRMHQNKEHDTE